MKKNPLASRAKTEVFFILVSAINLFSFAKEIIEQDNGFYMGSLDVDSLFNNILLAETSHFHL